ncbi:interferon-inducible double-stranded RNA-dependent protein kinase activator A-like isoform X2, partial [Leptotrombidium deliense]
KDLTRNNLPMSQMLPSQIKLEPGISHAGNSKYVDNMNNHEDLTNNLEKLSLNIAVANSAASELHELLTKRGLKWDYKEIGCTGADHHRQFEFEIIIGDKKFRGFGSQKKTAKQAAASVALQAIKGNPDILPPVPSTSTENQDKNPLNGDFVDNPISKLMELCAKNKIPPPEFALIYSFTPPSPPFFTMSCALKALNVVANGGGSTKQAAKREAAECALVEIETKGIFQESRPKTKVKTEANSNEAVALLKMKFLEELESVQLNDTIFTSLREEKFDCNEFLNQITISTKSKLEYLELDKTQFVNEYRCVCQIFIDEHKKIPIFTTWAKSVRSINEAKVLASRRAIFLILASRNI